MRYLLAVATTLALLGAAEPVADAGPRSPDSSTGRSRAVEARTPSQPGPRFRLAPEDGAPCVLPLAAPLLPCLRAPDREPRSCVVPVQAPGAPVPGCPRPGAPPEGRVVPLSR